jgi:hypothetical protein
MGNGNSHDHGKPNKPAKPTGKPTKPANVRK